MQRALIILAATILLAGCFGGSKPVYKSHYTLVGAAAAPSPGNGGGSPVVLRLSQITTPDWLTGTAMYYRLAYTDDNRLQSYSRAQWIGPPAAMLSSLVDGALAGSYRAVLGSTDTGDADYTLSLRLADLEQVFASAGASDCRLAVTATLINDHSQAVVGQHSFDYRHAAPSADAAGGVTCLRGRAGAFTKDLKQWLATTIPATSAQ